MVQKIMTAAVTGLDASIIEVEADVSNGLPNTIIVGLADAAVMESRERVKSAIKNSNLQYPFTRVSVNLAPAGVVKAGTHYDLPIALSILLASGQVRFDSRVKLFIGELSLDGRIRSASGILAMVAAAKIAGFDEAYVPAANVAEACLVKGIRVYGLNSVRELLSHLLGIKPIEVVVLTDQNFSNQAPVIDMADIAGQEFAKRALEITAAGQHNILMKGPPGSGKTMLARAAAGILPNLTLEECLELTKIYSIAGHLTTDYIFSRPVRAPHHTSSTLALIGGGGVLRPGEITLAHRGVLFLDELPEFRRSVIEALRQPLEDGVITLARAKQSVLFPARFMLVAAMNPCPCGFYGDPDRACTCAAGQIHGYHKKISGPLLDRIDLHVDVPRLPYEKISQVAPGEPSQKIKARVELARQRQQQRQRKTNTEMTTAEIRQFCKLDNVLNEIMRTAAKQYQLSGRGISRVLKVARTIADLAGSERLSAAHLAEALQYRVKNES